METQHIKYTEYTLRGYSNSMVVKASTLHDVDLVWSLPPNPALTISLEGPKHQQVPSALLGLPKRTPRQCLGGPPSPNNTQ